MAAFYLNNSFQNQNLYKQTMDLKPSQCYEVCNQKYSPMQPQRLFCKKGCDFEQQSLQRINYTDRPVAMITAINCVSRNNKAIKDYGSGFSIEPLLILALASTLVSMVAFLVIKIDPKIYLLTIMSIVDKQQVSIEKSQLIVKEILFQERTKEINSDHLYIKFPKAGTQLNSPHQDIQ